ncbi:MAG: hypothetical protein A2Y97_06970 [Nitrospirae bacterium RBG_13_39_12]|nr:MAG: hypothetical protein A2Y97_06970 [Nitrospirae bacterium RBG_13_39_12]
MRERTLLDYWIILYKRKIAVVLVTLISVITTAVLSLIIKPVYEAKAVFYVPESYLALSYMSSGAADTFARDRLLPSSKKEVAAPYVGLLKSTKIAEYIHQEYPRKKVEKLLRYDIDFELSNEYLLRIYSRDEDPALAANIANAYMKYLNLLLQEASLKNSGEDKDLLENQLIGIEKNLQDAQKDLKLFEEKNDIASVEEEIKNLTEQRVSFQTQLENTQVLIAENSKKMAGTIEQLKKEGSMIEENEFLLTNSSIEYLQQKLSDQAAQIAAASVELEKKHPDMMALRKQYKVTSNKLKREVQRLVSSQIKPSNTFYEQLRQNLVNLVVDQDKLKASMKGYTDTVYKINQRLHRLPSVKEGWTKLNDKIEQYKKIYERLNTDLQETEMQQARNIQFVVVVDYAKPPENPSFPLLWLNLIVALLFGLTAGIFYSFLTDYIEETSKIRKRKVIKELISGE